MKQLKMRFKRLTLPVIYHGRYRDTNGRLYKVYSPDCNAMGAWCRLEPVNPGYHARLIYDPGRHWRSILNKRRIATQPS